MKLNALLIILIFPLVKCQNKQYEKEYIIEGNNLFEVVYSQDGKSVIAKSSLNEDSIPDGISREFFSDGSMKSQTLYNNGKLRGEKLTFYPDVILKFIAQNDVDTITVEHQAIKSYEFYDSDEILRFRRYYNEQGHITEEEGSVFVTARINSNSLILGDSFLGQFYIVNPPHVNELMQVNIIGQNRFIVTDTIEIDNKYNAGFLDIPFDEVGKYRIEVIASITNPYDRKISQDTLMYNVIVKDTLN